MILHGFFMLFSMLLKRLSLMFGWFPGSKSAPGLFISPMAWLVTSFMKESTAVRLERCTLLMLGCGARSRVSTSPIRDPFETLDLYIIGVGYHIMCIL